MSHPPSVPSSQRPQIDDGAQPASGQLRSANRDRTGSMSRLQTHVCMEQTEPSSASSVSTLPLAPPQAAKCRLALLAGKGRRPDTALALVSGRSRAHSVDRGAEIISSRSRPVSGKPSAASERPRRKPEPLGSRNQPHAPGSPPRRSISPRNQESQPVAAPNPQTTPNPPRAHEGTDAPTERS